MKWKELGAIRWWPLNLLGAMWLNLNTGLWDLENISGWQGYFKAARVLAPYAVLPLAFVTLLKHKRLRGLRPGGPSECLMLYGLTAAVATVFSYDAYYSHYWSVAFLSSLLVCWAYVSEAPGWKGGRQLVTVTWIVCLAGAVTLAAMAPAATLGHTGTGYGISGELKEVSRSSGVARWAAVPGLVCLSRLIHSRRWLERAVYCGLALVAFWVVYRMQSRGAIFGVLGAIALLLICSSSGRTVLGVPLSIGAVVLVVLGSMGTFREGFIEYLHRGQSDEEFESMTGRTRAYASARVEIATSPIVGRGQWGDRLSPVVAEHVHNSFYGALLYGGFIGFVPYVLSWLTGWWLWLKLWRAKRCLLAEDRELVFECGLVMAFFTMRAIPETTTAGYAVDLLVMAACYCYLESLSVTILSTRKPMRPVRHTATPSLVQVVS